MAVEARKTLDSIEDDVQCLEIVGPAEPSRAASLWPNMDRWAQSVITNWANGQWPPRANDDNLGIMREIPRKKSAARKAGT
jgi:hypothetical protein